MPRTPRLRLTSTAWAHVPGSGYLHAFKVSDGRTYTRPFPAPPKGPEWPLTMADIVEMTASLTVDLDAIANRMGFQRVPAAQ